MGVVMNEKELLNDLRERVVDSFSGRLVALVVFGSWAKGVSTPESDMDILIVLNKEDGYRDYEEFFEKVESPLKDRYGIVKLSPVIRGDDHVSGLTSFLWDESYIILFDRDDFFSKVVEAIRRLKKEGKIIYKKRPLPHYVTKL